jgi:hypothetical protein
VFRSFAIRQKTPQARVADCRDLFSHILIPVRRRKNHHPRFPGYASASLQASLQASMNGINDYGKKEENHLVLRLEPILW